MEFDGLGRLWDDGRTNGHFPSGDPRGMVEMRQVKIRNI